MSCCWNGCAVASFQASLVAAWSVLRVIWKQQCRSNAPGTLHSMTTLLTSTSSCQRCLRGARCCPYLGTAECCPHLGTAESLTAWVLEVPMNWPPALGRMRVQPVEWCHCGHPLVRQQLPVLKQQQELAQRILHLTANSLMEQLVCYTLLLHQRHLHHHHHPC